MDKELITINTSGAKPAVSYLATLRSEVGRRGMVSALNTIALLAGAYVVDEHGHKRGDWLTLDWTRLTPETAQAIRAQLAGAPATVNKSLAALRGVARQLFDSRHISADDLRRIENATRAVKGSRLPAGRMVEDWEIAALLRACAADPSPAGARDACMIALAAKTGMRREELVSIKLSAISHAPEDGVELRIVGKGDRERTAFVDSGALAALRDWLNVRDGASHSGRAGVYLFCPINKGGVVDTSKRFENRGMTTTAAHLILQKRCDEAGVKGMAWHDLRRTVASTLLDKGEDISTVASVLGHAQIETTRKYDRRPEQAKRRAVRKISVPYFMRATVSGSSAT